MITNDVENYPGFPEKITGPDLMKAFREQSVVQGVEIITDDVNRVDLSKRPFTVWAGEGDGATAYQARTVIIATGAQARWLGLESEAALQGRGVSACAVCDGAFFRNQDVVVIGGGDTAMEEAMYLSGLCRTVDARAPTGRASARARRCRSASSRTPRSRSSTTRSSKRCSTSARARSRGSRVRNIKTSDEKVIPCTGFFVAIGHTPNTDLFQGQLELHDNGYIRTRPGSSYTNVPGVFACGDVQDFTYRQAVTAAGSGCMAALDAERWMAIHDAH